MRAPPAAPRSRAPRPAHLPEPGPGGSGEGVAERGRTPCPFFPPAQHCRHQPKFKREEGKGKKKERKGGSRRSGGGPGPGRAGLRPSRGARRGGGGAGAASELGGLGRGGDPRGGAGCPHLPRSSAAPTEAARVCPGDFPAPPDGSGRRVNAAARAAAQAPAARRRRFWARAAPSAGASPADGGAGASQLRLLPRRPLALPAGGRGYAARSRRGGVAPPGWPEQGARGWARGHRRTRGASGRGAPAMTSRLLSTLPGPPAPGGGAAGKRKTWPGLTVQD